MRVASEVLSEAFYKNWLLPLFLEVVKWCRSRLCYVRDGDRVQSQVQDLQWLLANVRGPVRQLRLGAMVVSR